MKRVEDVLGKGWENHIEGKTLKSDGDSFRLKLNTQELFEDWQRKVTSKQLGVSGFIFSIEIVRSRQANVGKQLRLKVNFMPEIITLSKEVRNLKWLGFRVPLAIVNKAHQANQLYPFAISLIETVRTYERTCSKVEEKSNTALLVAGMRRDIQNCIAEVKCDNPISLLYLLLLIFLLFILQGNQLVWESYKLDPYVQKFADVVSTFQERVDDLLVAEEQIEVEVKALDTCVYGYSYLINNTLEKLNCI